MNEPTTVEWRKYKQGVKNLALGRGRDKDIAQPLLHVSTAWISNFITYVSGWLYIFSNNISICYWKSEEIHDHSFALFSFIFAINAMYCEDQNYISIAIVLYIHVVSLFRSHANLTSYTFTSLWWYSKQ